MRTTPFQRLILPVLSGALYWLTGCAHSPSEPRITRTSFEKTLIPEGIAVSDGRLYLSSLSERKVAMAHLDGSQARDLSQSGEHGFAMGLGMETYRDLIYVLSSNSTTSPHESQLFVFNKHTGALHYTRQPDNQGHFFNDLAISISGELFITDSDNKTLYYKENEDADILPFLTSDAIQYTNGIAISDDNKLLYLATFQNGIQIVDKESRQIIGTATQDSTISTFCIDGMKFYKNSLIGIQNGWQDKSKHRVMRYFLNQQGTQITHAQVLIEANEYFDIPTTLDIDHDTLYFIANSQLDNFDEPTQQIKTPADLRPYYLITLKLD